MRAAIVEEIGKVNILDIPKPSPGYGEALVKITTAGVCHSDMHLMLGDWIEIPMPLPLGHEGIGMVEELGQGTRTDLKKGDRVILGLGGQAGRYWCGTCEYCLAGKPMYCSELQSMFGMFSEYVSIWANALVKLPDEISDNEVPLACGGLTAYSAIKKASNFGIPAGKTVAIIGAAGGLGHYAVQIAKAFGYKVIGVDVGSDKLDFVKKLGADYAIEANEAAKFIEDKFKGVHASIVFAAKISAYELGLKILRNGGALIAVGLPAFSEGSLSITPFELLMRGLHIFGSLVGNVQDMRELVQLAAEGKVKTHIGRFANLSEINQVFQELKEGKFVGRAIINNFEK